MKKIHIIILASGRGRRFGENKLMTSIHSKPMIEYTFLKISKLMEDKPRWLGRTCVITDHKQVKDLASQYEIPFIHNSKADEGISASIRCGTDEMKSEDSGDGLLFWVGDQPLISLDSIMELGNTFISSPKHIVVLRYGNRQGNPVIFPMSFCSKLLLLKGEEGGKTIIRNCLDQVRYVEAQSVNELVDVDSKKDLEYIKKLY